MYRKLPIHAALLSGVLLAVLATAQWQGADDDFFCGCEPSLVLDTSLPLSHPSNRCALKPQSQVSWRSWLTGKSSSYQFHYLDLLELLSRDVDDARQGS